MIRALYWERPVSQHNAAAAADTAGRPGGAPQGWECREVTLEDALTAWRERGALVWVDVASPTRPEMETISAGFGLHDVIVRTALQPNSRPKVAHFGDFITVTLYVPRAPHVGARGVPPCGIAGSGLAPLSEVDFVFAARYLITAHLDPVPLIDRLMDAARHDTEMVAKGMGSLVHRVLVETVNSYFPVLDRLVEQVEGIQQFA